MLMAKGFRHGHRNFSGADDGMAVEIWNVDYAEAQWLVA